MKNRFFCIVSFGIILAGALAHGQVPPMPYPQPYPYPPRPYPQQPGFPPHPGFPPQQVPPQPMPPQPVPPPQQTPTAPVPPPTPIPAPTPVPLTTLEGRVGGPNGLDLTILASEARERNLRCTLNAVDHFPDDLMADDRIRPAGAFGKGNARCSRPWEFEEKRANPDGSITRIIHKYTPVNVTLMRDFKTKEVMPYAKSCIERQKKELERFLALPDHVDLLRKTFRVNRVFIDYTDNAWGEVRHSLTRTPLTMSGDMLILPVSMGPNGPNDCTIVSTPELMRYLQDEEIEMRVTHILKNLKNPNPIEQTRNTIDPFKIADGRAGNDKPNATSGTPDAIPEGLLDTSMPQQPIASPAPVAPSPSNRSL